MIIFIIITGCYIYKKCKSALDSPALPPAKAAQESPLPEENPEDLPYASRGPERSRRRNHRRAPSYDEYRDYSDRSDRSMNCADDGPYPERSHRHERAGNRRCPAARSRHSSRSTREFEMYD